MKYYAYINDDQGKFDCILESDSLDDLHEHVDEYCQEFTGHYCLFKFHGKIVDLEKTVENLD